MMMIRTLLVCTVSVIALNVDGQTVSTPMNIETSFTLASNSMKSGSNSARSLEPTFTSTPTMSFKVSSPPRGTVTSSIDTSASSDSVAVILTSSPAIPVTSVLPSVSSSNIGPSATVQDQAISSLYTSQTAGIYSDNESYPHSFSDDQTASITTTVSSRVPDVFSESSNLNTLPSKQSSISSELAFQMTTLENTTIPFTASESATVQSTAMSSVLSSEANKSITEISSSVLLEALETNTSSSYLGATDTYRFTSESLESSTFVIQTLSSRSAESELHGALSTTSPTDSTATIRLPSSSYTASENESNVFPSESDFIFSTITANYFTESVYELANMTYTSVPAADLDSAVESSISTAGRTSNTVAEVISSRTPSLLDTIRTSNETVDVTSKSALLNASITETHTTTTFSPTETTAFDIGQSVSDSDYLYTSESILAATATSFTLATESPSTELPVPNITGTIETSEAGTSYKTILTSTLTSLLETPPSSDYSPVYSESYFNVTQGSPATFPSTVASSESTTQSVTHKDVTTTPSMVSSPEEHTTTRLLSTTENSTKFQHYLEHSTYRVMFTFDGGCDALKENEILREEFWKVFIDIIRMTTKLEADNLEPENMLCDPLRIYLRIDYFYNTTDAPVDQLFESIKSRVASSRFNVPIIDGMRVLNFTATNVDIVEVISDGPEVAKTGLELTDIVIISIASFLFAVLVLMMIIVLCRECYVRKRTTTFHLTEIPHVNLKLSDFTLTRIPRPQMFYRENSLRKPEPVPLSKVRHSHNGRSSKNSNGKVKVNVDNINVRMRNHQGGLVVGITCSDPPGPNNDASSASSSPKSGDQSKRSLLKGEKNGDSDGVTNPSYSTDEEVQGNTKIVIQDDENEQLL